MEEAEQQVQQLQQSVASVVMMLPLPPAVVVEQHGHLCQSAETHLEPQGR